MSRCMEKLPEQSLELRVDLRPTCVILVKSFDNICYLITGDSNGSICFYLNGTRVMRYACPSACYDKTVTALAYGNLLNKDEDGENLVIVHADGYLQAITLPIMDHQGLSISKPPTEVFFDLLDVNICSTTICDIDSDNKDELIAVFVNGSVRLYRFELDEGLKEVQVWDFHSNITCFSLGRYQTNFFSAFVLTGDRVTYKLIFFPSASVKPQAKHCKDSYCILPANCIFSTLCGSDMDKVFIQVNDGKTAGFVNKELKKIDQHAIICVGATVFHDGRQVIVTSDCYGRICIYVLTLGASQEIAIDEDAQNVCNRYLKSAEEKGIGEDANIANETSLETAESSKAAHNLPGETEQCAVASNFYDAAESDSSETHVKCKKSYIFPYLCSKLGTSPVHLTVLEDPRGNGLLVGLVSIDKRIHLYRYKFE